VKTGRREEAEMRRWIRICKSRNSSQNIAHEDFALKKPNAKFVAFSGSALPLLHHSAAHFHDSEIC
jgi:hypothetical protein